MNKFFKSKKTRAWFITTASVVTFFLVVTILASSLFANLISIVFGSKRTIYAEGEGSQAFEKTTESKEDATSKGNDLSKELCEEGIVMLKNDNNALPLANSAKISVFGKNSVNLVYGGSGSGGGDNSTAATLYQSLSDAGFTTNPTLKSFYENTSQSGAVRDSNPSDLDSGGNVMLSTAETPYSSYTTEVKNSYSEYNDAAIVLFSRIGGEGFDLPRTSRDDSSRTYLELDPNEQALITNVTNAGFKHVIVLINSANVMELGFVKDNTLGKIDGCLWCGGPGNQGIMALGEILNGTKNPSGHTVDTYPYDLTKDPSFQNFGDCNITEGDRYITNQDRYYFVDYEESVYVGYRYYETRGNSDGETWYSSNVCYPFGYGLSYTTFSWSLVNSDIKDAAIEKGKEYTVEVKVTNTGSVAGKEVVELYASAPYTSGGIEKPFKVLTGFEKTGVIEPGKSENVTIKVNPYYFASYDYTDANSNGFKGYELEKGNYNLFVSSNSHDSNITIPFSVSDTIEYATDETTGNTVENRFDDSDDHLQTLLSRSDWNGTYPQSPTDTDRQIDQTTIDKLASTTTNNPNTYTEMPTQGADYGEDKVVFKDLVGLDYYDDKWDTFLNQLTVEEMASLYNNGAFMTNNIFRLGVPKTTCSDGPVGFVNFMGDPSVYGTVAYPCEVMMASTWNKSLLKNVGESLGQEGLWGNVAGDGAPYSGIYSPGSNIHRSAFGGRNFEYFSEDPYLAGEMAANEISGAKANGLIMFMKHFALNEQETHRASNGDVSWATEQAMREIYLRPFEIAVKEGGAMGIMSSFNRIGTQWTGGDYRLLTEVLRNEWGFDGTVICDFNTNSYMSSKQMCYAGGDLNLTTTRPWSKYDSSSASDVTVLRKAAHNVLYSVVHSNAMNAEIIGYNLPYWQIILYVIDGVIVLGLGILGFFAIRSVYKKTPEDQKPVDDKQAVN